MLYKNRYFRKKKYNNCPSNCISGHKHDSRREADYCTELTYQIRANEITSFEIQRNYPLIVNGKTVCFHRVDFEVINKEGKKEIREVKGFANDVWRIKKNLFEALFPEIPYYVIK